MMKKKKTFWFVVTVVTVAVVAFIGFLLTI